MRDEPAAAGRATWTPRRSRALLATLTVLCLLPFVGKAYHVDDTLFVWVGQQVVRHPGDPYGFPVVWYSTEMPMAEVTKNPPLTCYFIALAGACFGWSEVALHLAFLVPALVTVLGIYELARGLTRRPLLAAAATLVAPAFLVSATSVMSDVPMLACWVVALCLWRRGLDRDSPWYLAAAALLAAVCALTKYFGVALLPLLLGYTLLRRRGVGHWAWFFLVPVAVLAAYQYWTASLYGRGLLSDAAEYAQTRKVDRAPLVAALVVGLSFVGGCVGAGLTFAPLLWPRRWIAVCVLVAALAGVAIAWGWFDPGSPPPFRSRWGVAVQAALYVAGGISVLGLAVRDAWERRTADSALLLAWVLGTFVFACFVNWTVNARSVLPLVPAAGILLARRLEGYDSGNQQEASVSGTDRGTLRKTADGGQGKSARAPARRPNRPVTRQRQIVPENPVSLDAGASPRIATWKLILPLGLSGILGLGAAAGDAALADSAREAARLIQRRADGHPGRVYFTGHWGFQYYMEAWGARPVDLERTSLAELAAADLIVSPQNNTNPLPPLRPDAIAFRDTIVLDLRQPMTTVSRKLGAGFYSASWGPLPFAIGRVSPEEYDLVRLRPLQGPGPGR
jgi:hypothetical protein